MMTFFQINESRSRDWNLKIHMFMESSKTFKLMNPVRGIETGLVASLPSNHPSFKLMNPVRGIETRLLCVSEWN